MTTVVIVPGSFMPAHTYTTFTHSLSKQGIQSVVVELPSVGKREGRAPQTMTDDANEISRVALEIMDQGREVVLMMHSYAGIRGSQSLETLSWKQRRAQGKAGGVRKAVYLAARILSVGTSSRDVRGNAVPAHLTIEDDYMTIDPTLAAPLTFSDLAPKEALERQQLLDVHSTASFAEKLRYPGYNDVEVHYIVCEEDRVIAPEKQYAMVKDIEASGGGPVKVHKIKSGHVPTTSQPDKLAEMVKAVVEGA